MRRGAPKPAQRIIEFKEEGKYPHGTQTPERVALKRRRPNEPLGKRDSNGDPLNQVGLLFEQKGPLSVASEHHAEDVLELVHGVDGLPHESEVLMEKAAQGIGKISTASPYQLIDKRIFNFFKKYQY